MFKSYRDFENHEHNFNTLFSTAATCSISLLLVGVLAANGFFNNSSTWFVILILVVIPFIVYVATSSESEFRTAYYKTWKDKIAGKTDQRKILKQFAKQYGIKNWHTRLEDIKTDGRWNFHIDTNYMHALTEQRDLLLNQIYQEYLNQLTTKNELILEAKRAVVNLEVELDTAEKIENEAKDLLSSAKSSGEIYKQRQDYSACVEHTKDIRQKLNNAGHELSVAQQDKDNLINIHREIARRITKIYYARYSKYTEPAVKKINRINGLKYVIADMPNPEAWVKNPAMKESK